MTNQLITNNVIIAFKSFHTIYNESSTNTRHMTAKLDMQKTYDRVEWDYLRSILDKMEFLAWFSNCIMRCLSLVSFSVLVNGVASPTFIPIRGLREGDPLSLFLFIICAKGMSGLLRKDKNSSQLMGLHFGCDTFRISHLLFANDCLVFSKATEREAVYLKDIFATF